MGELSPHYFRAPSGGALHRCSISGLINIRRGRRAPNSASFEFTLRNGFTFVEAYLERGMHITTPSLADPVRSSSGNGMDPESRCSGASRGGIWSFALRDAYGANERRQKLKYHVQTSGAGLQTAQGDPVQRHPHDLGRR